MEIKLRVTPNAQARLEMARERARVMERKPTATVSALEQAAEKWQRQEEMKKRGVLETHQRSASR